MEKATWQIRTSFRMMLRPQLESSHSISGELYGGVLMLDLKDKLSQRNLRGRSCSWAGSGFCESRHASRSQAIGSCMSRLSKLLVPTCSEP